MTLLGKSPEAGRRKRNLSRSPGEAQRNPGSADPLARLFPDFAALHPGYA